MTSKAQEKECRERFYLDRFLETAQIKPESIVRGADPPDFVLTLDGRLIAVEETEFYSSPIEHDSDHRRGGAARPRHPDGRTRKAVEEEWRKLQCLFEQEREQHSDLDGVSGLLFFKQLEVPSRREHSAFVQELLDLARSVSGVLTAEGSFISSFPRFPLLSKYLTRLHLLNVGCHVEWGWNHSAGSVGLTHSDLQATVLPKLRTSRPADATENWLLVVSGHQLSQSMGLPRAEELRGYQELSKALEQGPYNRVYIFQHMFDRVLLWQLPDGWVEIYGPMAVQNRARSEQGSVHDAACEDSRTSQRLVTPTRRVFVLGSGFSASVGLPILAGLFRELMETPERRGEKDKENVLDALERLYPHFNKETTPTSYPPFEEFLSLLTVAEDVPSLFYKGYWEERRISSLRLLTDCIASKSKQVEKCGPVQQFVNRLQYGDVVVTFNWDNLIERTLWERSRKVSLLSRDSDAVTLLKLHGSLNWVRIPVGSSLTCPESVVQLSDRIHRTPDYRYYDVWDVANEPPLIVPPISSKLMPWDGLFEGIWGEALTSLVDGESVSFIGYSIPKEDLQARAFLSLAWSARVSKGGNKAQFEDRYTLIDPNPSVRDRYASVLSGRCTYYERCFSSGLLPDLFRELPS